MVWRPSPLWALLLVGCASSNENSPTMGEVPPKPNPNMNAQLPASVRQQLANAKPGSDAAAMRPNKGP